MSSTQVVVAPRPLIKDAPLDPSVPNYALAIGYYTSGGTPNTKTGLSGHYSASVTESESGGYVTWTMRFVLTTPMDIPADSTAYIYAYDPSSNKVLDYATFTPSSTIGTGTEIELIMSVRVARCMYKILSCSVPQIICGNYAIIYNIYRETLTISTGAHTFEVYKTFALVGSSPQSTGSVGSTVTCRLYCGNTVIYDIGSFTLTDVTGHTYYACLNLASVQPLI